MWASFSCPFLNDIQQGSFALLEGKLRGIQQNGVFRLTQGCCGPVGIVPVPLLDIQERDWNDSHRAAAPLRQAEDAVLLDTTELTFQESEAALLDIIQERTGK